VARTEPVATLVDSNVLLDILVNDPRWFAWSYSATEAARDQGPLIINPLIYAEVSAGFATAEEIDGLLDPSEIFREQIPWSAAFLAGKAHLRYRRSGGTRTNTLPDFFIGAHAAVTGLRLLTRDPRRYRTYFPTLEILAPS